MKFKFLYSCLCVIIFLAANTTRIYYLDTEKELDRGVFENTYLNSVGALSLTPSCKELKKLEELVVWSLFKNDRGLYAGTGHSGKIFLLGPANEIISEITLDVQEIIVMTGKAAGPLYVGTGPKGLIFKVSPDLKKAEIFTILPEEFIWDLELSGNYLYAATGGTGMVYKIDLATGKRDLIFVSSEDNVLEIKVKDKQVYASTSGQGYLYRIRDLKDFDVLYDAGGSDINDFIFVKDSIVLATSGRKLITPPPPPKNGKKRGFPKGYFKNHIVVIDSKDNVSIIHSIKDQTIPSLVKKNDTAIYYGTTESGEIYEVNLVNGKAEKLYKIDNASISQFYKHKKDIFFSTGTGGSIYKLELSFPELGTYTSDVLDVTETAQWGKVSFLTYNGKEGIRVLVRTGDSENPALDWGDWKPTGSDNIIKQSSRFVQIKLELMAKGGISPALSDLKIFYAQKGKDVRLKSINFGRNHKMEKVFKLDIPRGQTLLSWKVENPGRMPLEYNIYYRSRLVKDWELIKDELNKAYLIINRKTFVDSEYEFKVEAVDIYDKNSNAGIIDSIISKKYVVDNTPPDVVDFRIESENSFSFVVQDSTTSIGQVTYSIKPNEFLEVLPLDNVLDSAKEDFKIKLESESSYLILNVEDLLGNSKQQSFSLQEKK